MSSRQHSIGLTEKEASDYIGMSRSWLRKRRMDFNKTGATVGPAFVTIGRNIRYPIESLDEWIETIRQGKKQG